MSDLVERLRKRQTLGCTALHIMAADEIDRLTAALKPFADAHVAMSTPNVIIDPYEHITLHDLRMAYETLAAVDKGGSDDKS